MTILFSVVIASPGIRKTKTLTVTNFNHLQKQVDLTKIIINHYYDSLI